MRTNYQPKSDHFLIGRYVFFYQYPLIFESIKTPIALAFVVYFDLGIQGVIITILLAYFIRIAIQLYFAKNKLKNQFSWHVLKNWIKISWVSLYEMFPKYIRKIDVVIFLLITNSVIGLAYYHVSLVIAKLILNSSLISQGLYPKLLADGPSSHIKDIFTLTMYFAIPLLAISIIFSKPALFALNPLYQGAEIIVILLAINAFLTVPNSIFQKVLKGIEKVDANENPKFKDLIKSNLFTISTAQIIRNVIYIGLLVGGLMIFTFNSDKSWVISDKNDKSFNHSLLYKKSTFLFLSFIMLLISSINRISLFNALDLLNHRTRDGQRLDSDWLKIENVHLHCTWVYPESIFNRFCFPTIEFDILIH